MLVWTLILTNRNQTNTKGNKSQREEGKKKYFSNIKCFHCHEFEHYVTKCAQNKARNKELAVATVGEDLASQFELHFIHATCMESTITGSMQYLQSGAPFNMTGNGDLFSDLEKKYLKKKIEFVDDEGPSIEDSVIHIRILTLEVSNACLNPNSNQKKLNLLNSVPKNRKHAKI